MEDDAAGEAGEHRERVGVRSARVDHRRLAGLRRDGEHLEVRLAECFGRAGTAYVTLALPHRGAALTNLTGGESKPLAGGPRYEFPVRAQQIVTLRFRTSGSVPAPKPLLDWEPLVPPAKRAMLKEYSSEKGHPPRGV